ncbi:MAG: hypothetical protein U0V70_00565 [Terriglobia bacterium]
MKIPARLTRYPFLLLYAWGWMCILVGSAAAQKRDYLTLEETNQLRDAQQPELRMNLLTGFLNRRFEEVRSASVHKDAAKEEKGEQEPISPDRASEPAKPNGGESHAKEKKEAPKTLEELLNDYLDCLDEVSTNIENSGNLPMDPKEFLKALNKLDGYLQKQQQWFRGFDTKGLEKSEREVDEEILQAQRELAEDLQKTMNHLVEEIKRIKEAKKAAEKKQ